MDKYKRSIEILAISKSDLIFNNSNHDHANIVLTNIFKHANNSICIYDESLSGDIAEKDPQLLDEIINFVKNKDSHLKICVKKEAHENEFQDKIIELSNLYSNKLDIRIADELFINRIIEEFSSDIYFSVGDDDMFRLEYGDTSIQERKAICSFNNKEYPKKILSVFNEKFNELESLVK